MLSRDDNELLTRTGPGTPMGALLRHYWIPVVLSSEVAAGGRVKRVKLLGERLIAFRAKNGRPGLVGEFCPHRSASLYFGRVEDAGMRCVYHGWKFGDGRPMPRDAERAPESGFAAKIRHVGYPCEERGGMIWAYMGPATPPPPLPHLEWTRCPRRTRSRPNACRSATGSRRWRAGSTRATSRSSTPRSTRRRRRHPRAGPRELRRRARPCRRRTGRRGSRWRTRTTAC